MIAITNTPALTGTHKSQISLGFTAQSVVFELRAIETSALNEQNDRERYMVKHVPVDPPKSPISIRLN